MRHDHERLSPNFSNENKDKFNEEILKKKICWMIGITDLLCETAIVH